MDIRLYDINKRLNHTSDHASMRGCDVFELHLNKFNTQALGTEVLIKQGLDPDALDKAILGASAKYFKNRGFKPRSDLYNMNTFAAMGIPYRLLECCFIDNAEDMRIFDNQFDAYAKSIADAIKSNYTKPVVIVAGHGAGDPGAQANGRDEAVEVRRLAQLVYGKLVGQVEQPQPVPQPQPTPTPDTNIVTGNRIRIIAPYKRYIADDVQTKFGIVQVRENVLAGGEGSFEWKDNGIPEQCIDLTDANGNKRSDSDRVHPRKGDYFVFNTSFTVTKTANVGGKKYLQLDFNGNSNYHFWVVAERCQKA